MAVEPRFSSLPGSADETVLYVVLSEYPAFRMGRDYPVELALVRLCKSGFAWRLSRIARGSRTEVLIPAVKYCRNGALRGAQRASCFSDGQGFEPWVPVKEHTLSKRAQSTALPPIQTPQCDSNAHILRLSTLNFQPSTAAQISPWYFRRQSTITSKAEGFMSEVRRFYDL